MGVLKKLTEQERLKCRLQKNDSYLNLHTSNAPTSGGVRKIWD